MCHPTHTSTLFRGLYSSLARVNNSFNGLVEVTARPSQQVFPLHKEIPYDVCSCFRSTLEDSFVEGLTWKIEPPEDNVAVFVHLRMALFMCKISRNIYPQLCKANVPLQEFLVDWWVSLFKLT